MDVNDQNLFRVATVLKGESQQSSWSFDPSIFNAGCPAVAPSRATRPAIDWGSDECSQRSLT